MDLEPEETPETPPKRLFFGSLEHELAEGGIQRGTATAAIQAQQAQIMGFSEDTTREIERHQKMVDSLDAQKKMREISVPTNDDHVKARLVELGEPIILFGEEKPDRRERLRRLLFDRGLTEGTPTTVLRSRTGGLNQETVQTEVFATQGPKELKKLRVALTKSSLELAKTRLEQRREIINHLENNWEKHEAGFNALSDYMSKFTEAKSTVGDSRPLTSIAYSPDGGKVATTSWSGELKIWDVATCTSTLKMNAHGQRSQSVSWYHAPTSTGSLNLASCGADDKIQLWSLDSDKPLKTLAGHVGRVNNVVFHPQYSWIASTSFDKTWCLWDLETGKELINQGGNSKAVYGLAFHCDGALVATAGLDATCRLWDLRSGKAIWNLRGHAKQIIGLDFAPHGYHIATGSDDRTVRIWDLRKRQTANIILAHTNLISTVKYQPVHGNYIVTSSYDKTVKVWSAKNWGLIRTLSGHEDKITAVDISPKDVIVPFRFNDSKKNLSGGAFKQEVKKENNGYVKVKIEGETEDDDHQDKMEIDANGQQQEDMDVEEKKYQECINDPFLQGYKPTLQLVTSSFDRTWKIWETDPLADI